MERTSTTAVTLFLRLVYSDLNQSGLSQRLRVRGRNGSHGPEDRLGIRSIWIPNNRRLRMRTSCWRSWATWVFFFLVSRTRHHSCAGHCFTIRSHCNFFRNATIPPGRNKQQRKTKQTATKQNQQRNTNQTQTENQTPEWKLSSLLLYNIQLK